MVHIISGKPNVCYDPPLLPLRPKAPFLKFVLHALLIVTDVRIVFFSGTRLTICNEFPAVRRPLSWYYTKHSSVCYGQYRRSRGTLRQSFSQPASDRSAGYGKVSSWGKWSTEQRPVASYDEQQNGLSQQQRSSLSQCAVFAGSGSSAASC